MAPPVMQRRKRSGRMTTFTNTLLETLHLVRQNGNNSNAARSRVQPTQGRRVYADNRSSISRRTYRTTGRSRDDPDSPVKNSGAAGDTAPPKPAQDADATTAPVKVFRHGSSKKFSITEMDAVEHGTAHSGMDDDDDALSDGETNTQLGMGPDDQDESAYFSQRMGNQDFKVSHRMVLHPHGRTRASWDVLLLLFLTWILVSVPFELTFKEIGNVTRATLLRIDLFVDIMFAIDIILNFNTGVEENGRLHFSLQTIVRAYMRSWFFTDVIWTFPFYMFAVRSDVLALTFPSMNNYSPALVTAMHHSWLYPSLRCLRLLRVISIPRIQRRIEYSLLISSKLSGLSTFVYMVLALSHVFSCVFAYLAFGDEEHLAVAIENQWLENDSAQTKYIAAFYWSMMTMTTVGYGDITVRTNTGRVFSMAAMAVGGGVFAYGITSVVSLFQQLYEGETEHRHKMDQVNDFMHSRSLSRKVRDEIRANIFHLRKATRSKKNQDQAIFQQLSRTIQGKIADRFCLDVMPKKMSFLAGSNAGFIHELYLVMEVRCYLPGEDIIRQDEYGTEMHFLLTGHVQVYLGHVRVATLAPNSCFGEFGIINPRKPRLATIQSIDFCETHCVDRAQLLTVLVQHPFMLQSIKQLATLKSRKAFNLLFESGGRSRTLLQGLASIWHAEGVHGMLPPGMVLDQAPALQEYVIPSSFAYGGRTSSVRMAPGAAMAASAALGRRKMSMAPLAPEEMQAGLIRKATMELGSVISLRRQSISGPEQMGDMAHQHHRRPSLSGSEDAVDMTEQAFRLLPAQENAEAKEAAKRREDLLTALQQDVKDLLKRQDALQRDLHGLIETITPPLRRVEEKNSGDCIVPPLKRERSQYFQIEHLKLIEPTVRRSSFTIH